MVKLADLERYLSGENDPLVMFRGKLLQVNTENMQYLIDVIDEMQNTVIGEVKERREEETDMRDSGLFSAQEIERYTAALLEAERIAELLNISEENF